jgi:hypothetical protein
MTTSHSPLSKLKAQSDQIAKNLKAAERGEPQPGDGYGKIAAARKTPSVKFAIMMDDKLITIEMEWTTIAEYSEVALSEYILKQMRHSRSTPQQTH